MKTIDYADIELSELKTEAMEELTAKDTKETEVFTELEKGVYAALETYSNVHRGSGHNSMVTTHLYEHARNVVLDYIGLSKRRYVVIFCTPRSAEVIKSRLEPNSYQILSSQDIGLSLGVRALAVKRKALPKGIPFQTGGGTARLVSPDRITWSHIPGRFEAGTPAIINVIAFVRALILVRQYGDYTFHDAVIEKTEASEILYHDELNKYSGQVLLDELKKTLIGRHVNVPTLAGSKSFINMDNGASNPTFEPIWNAVCQTWRQSAQIQQAIIHKVRSVCADFLGAPLSAYDVTFTSNTTEAINLAAKSFSNDSEKDVETVVLNTLLEHSSNELPWRLIPGFSLIRLEVDDKGFMDLKEMETLLCEYNQEKLHGKKRIKLVAVSGASNVLGVFNDLAEISRIVHQYGAQLLVDAAQLVAHRKLEVEKCGIDYLAFSAHKVYAPFGCGVLISRKGYLNFNPNELKLIQTSGEENTVGIAALGKSIVLLQRIGMDLIREEEQALTRRALKGMAKIKDLSLYGIKNPDLPEFEQKGGVILFSLKVLYADKIAKALAIQGGIGIRSGCHCAHLMIKRLVKISPILARLQHIILLILPKIELPGLARVSLGIQNSEEDVDTLIQVLDNISRQPRAKADRQSTTRDNGTPIIQQKDVQQQLNDFIMAAAHNVYYIQ